MRTSPWLSTSECGDWFVWPDEDFPRTSTQKPRTNVIQQVVQSRLGGKDSGAISQTPLAELISRVTGRAAGKANPETDLETDLNLTSLDRVELMGALEDRFQVDLSETGFAAVNTVEMSKTCCTVKLRRAGNITIQHGCSVGPRPGTGWLFSIFCCVLLCFCWAGLKLRDGKICARFAARF